jgi:peptide/nickel transport system substrate-binding protein
VTRRASRKPIAEGGWNAFGTGWIGMLDPTLNQPLRCDGGTAWFGWPGDDTIEALRREWIAANDLEERQAIAAKIQARAFAVVPFIPTGQFTPKTAYRKSLRGVIPAPVILMWNVAKT